MSDWKGALFMHELVGALLPFSGKVAVGEMVAVKALMGSTVGAIEDGEEAARQAPDVNFTESETCCRASGVLIGVFGVENVCIPVMLAFVANHGLYFCHGVVDTFDAAVTTRGVGACRAFVYTEGEGVHLSHYGVRFKPMASIFAMVR